MNSPILLLQLNLLLSIIAKTFLKLLFSNQSVVFLSSSGLLISIGFSIDSLILASTLFFHNCSFSFLNCSFSFFNFSLFSFLNFSFSSFLTFSFSSFNYLFSTSCCVKMFSSLKHFLDVKISSCSLQMTS